MPPRIASWEQLAESLSWGERSGFFRPGAWWWELRPHRRFGTLEFRVPDGQSSLADATAVVAVVQALVAWLGERYDAGEPLIEAPSWRVAENRWSACHRGVEGEMADLRTGAVRSTRECLHELIDALAPVGQRLDCSTELAQARALVETNGAMRQRRVASEQGIAGLGQWLSERFLAHEPG